MKNSKIKIIFTIIFIIIGLFMFNKVYGFTEYEENLIYKIAPDGKNATFKTIKPKNKVESDLYLTNLVNYLLNDDEYMAYAVCTDDELTNCEITIYKNNGNSEDFMKKYNIKIAYEEPTENKNIEEIVKKLKTFNDMNLDTYYKLNDLNLINYYNTSNKSELWYNGSPGRALKYCDDIINISDGSDVSFYIYMRAGSDGENLMYEYAFGEMSLFYDGYMYANKKQGIHLQRVLYIPQNTADTKEAYIEAAQKRINDYLGTNNGVIVTYGGTLESLANLDSCNEDESVPRESTDGNYYNITIKGRTYKFYIIKGSQEKLKEPTYKGKHLKSNIEVTTNSSVVPLDTHLNVNSVKSDKISQIIGTDDYIAFDISLYSDGKKEKITKLDNGKFLVSIPIDNQFEGKEITTYYINNNNEKIEYSTIIRDGMAEFETDHFSTYVLAEKENEQETENETENKNSNTVNEQEDTPQHILDNEPKTGLVNISAIILSISIISLLGNIIINRKINK